MWGYILFYIDMTLNHFLSPLIKLILLILLEMIHVPVVFWLCFKFCINSVQSTFHSRKVDLKYDHMYLSSKMLHIEPCVDIPNWYMHKNKSKNCFVTYKWIIICFTFKSKQVYAFSIWNDFWWFFHPASPSIFVPILYVMRM